LPWYSNPISLNTTTETKWFINLNTRNTTRCKTLHMICKKSTSFLNTIHDFLTPDSTLNCMVDKKVSLYSLHVWFSLLCLLASLLDDSMELVGLQHHNIDQLLFLELWINWIF
jgi:hypothetical protein